MTIEKLKEYLQNPPSGGWVVTGHPAPDTDAAISALFEAYRLTCSGTPARPVLQGALSRETAWLLGDLAPLVPTVDTLDPTVPLVLTDHNDMAAYPNPIRRIVDHHPLTEGADLTGIEAEIAPVGAATVLVTRRLRGDGLTPDAACACLLLGAILMDTENLAPHKAKAEDLEMTGWLTALCGEDTDALFATLQEKMLAETDVERLYRRDYRRYTNPDGTVRLGWAILKVWEDTCPELDAVRRLLAEDSAPTRLAKLVLNRRGRNGRIEFYLAAGEEAEEMLELVQTVAEETAVRVAPDTVFLPQSATQWSRKRYVALLKEVWRKKS